MSTKAAIDLQVLALIGLRKRQTLVATNIDLIKDNVKLAEDFFQK